jgi:hypothetical protein
MVRWLTWSTLSGGRRKYGEGDLVSLVGLRSVWGLGKLHRSLVKLTKQLAWMRGGWGNLVVVAGVRVARVGGAALSGAKNLVGTVR